MAARWGIESIHQEDQHVVFTYRSRSKMDRLAKASQRQVRVVDGRSAYVSLDAVDADGILSRVEAVLLAE
jgi:hypothetical protein